MPNHGSSGDRLLAALQLFTPDEPEWTVEDAAERLGISNPTAYRYFHKLGRTGLICAASRASYVLGPTIIELDRQIQLCDPLLKASRLVMDRLIQHDEFGSTILLCRLFRDRVICIGQAVGSGPQGPISYERGRPMPLFRGATSKIVLAHLPLRVRKALYEQNRQQAKSWGLGDTWEQFGASLAALRRAGACITAGEIDKGRTGLAVPIFGSDRAVIGSLTFVLPRVRATESVLDRLVPLTMAAAREIERAMACRHSPA